MQVDYELEDVLVRFVLFSGDDARDAREVIRYLYIAPLRVCLQDSANMLGRAVAEFENQYSAVAEKRAGLRDKATVDFDARGPAEECGRRFVVPHLTRKFARLIARDVRRIAYD